MKIILCLLVFFLLFSTSNASKLKLSKQWALVSDNNVISITKSNESLFYILRENGAISIYDINGKLLKERKRFPEDFMPHSICNGHSFNIFASSSNSNCLIQINKSLDIISNTKINFNNQEFFSNSISKSLDGQIYLLSSNSSNLISIDYNSNITEPFNLTNTTGPMNSKKVLVGEDFFILVSKNLDSLYSITPFGEKINKIAFNSKILPESICNNHKEKFSIAINNPPRIIEFDKNLNITDTLIIIDTTINLGAICNYLNDYILEDRKSGRILVFTKDQ